MTDRFTVLVPPAPARDKVGNRITTDHKVASEAGASASAPGQSDTLPPQMLRSAGAAPETLAPLLEQPGARSDADDTTAEAHTAAAARMTLTIESLVPVRGHVLEVSGGDSVGQLKSLYLERLREEMLALQFANCSAESQRRPNQSNANSRAEKMSHAAVQSEFETRCRLIFDGTEVESSVMFFCTLAWFLCLTEHCTCHTLQIYPHVSPYEWPAHVVDAIHPCNATPSSFGRYASSTSRHWRLLGVVGRLRILCTSFCLNFAAKEVGSYCLGRIASAPE